MKARFLGRIGRLGGLAALCAGAALAIAGAPAANAAAVSCSAITGSGSSLQALAQETVWSTNWNAGGPMLTEWESLLCNSMEGTVNYKPTSSGKGLGSWGSKNGVLTPAESFNKEKLDEFVGTDVGPEGGPAGLAEGMVEAKTQIAEMDKAGGNGGKENKVITFPIAQSAISVIVSLPEGCVPSTAKAHVSNMALWEAWDKDTVTFSEFVKGVTLTGASCTTAPLLEAREVGSGTTAGFKRYLDDLENTVYGACTSTAVESESPTCWPDVKPDETGNETGGDLAEKVYMTAGTTGYADLADAIKKSFAKPGEFVKHSVSGKEFYSAILLVPNDGAELPEEGEAVSPEVSSTGASNCSGAKYPEPKTVAADVDWSRARQSNSTASETGVYPICTLTFDVAWQQYNLPEWTNAVTSAKEKYTEAQYHTVFGYLRYVVTEGQKGTAATEIAKAHFAVLPSALQKVVEKGVTMENIYLETAGK